MKRILLLSFMFSLLLAVGAYAQRTVSGTVTSIEDGSTVPGVNVVLKGTTTGTTTDLDGNYRLSVPEGGGTLVFSFIGLAAKEVEIGARSVIDVQMESDVKQLTEVVVTAAGVEREKRSLGYAVATVQSDQVEGRPDADIGRILNGKLPGVNITPATGLAGTGTNIVIRGYNSVSGSNQPLFIVDGVPFNTNTNTIGGFTGGSLNASSRFLDIDPNNIASVSVLKGLAASVKYGEQGRNGVILITTKSGQSKAKKKSFEVGVQQNYFITEIASLPEFQNSYGGGFHQSAGNFFSNWGAHFDDVDSVPHPYSLFSNAGLRAAFPEFAGKQYSYEPYPGPEEFFQKGFVSNTSVSLSGSNEQTSWSSVFSYNNEEGFVPNNTLERVNFGVGLNSSLTDKLSIQTSMNLSRTEAASPPMGASTGSSAVGDGSALFANVMYTPRHIDLMGLPYQSPVDGRSVYYRSGNDIPNPNWLVENTRASNSTNRIYGRTQVSYDILDNLTVLYRAGIDTYNEDQEYLLNKGIGPGPANANLNAGLYRTQFIKNTIFNQDFIADFSQELTSDLSMQLLVGYTIRQDRIERDGMESTQQNIFNFVEHGNFINHSSTNSFSGADIQFKERENLYGAYFDLTLDYRQFLYLVAQGRNDWSSTVESENQSIFYPSISLSFLPTTAFAGLQSNALNELKIRASYATSAGFPDPYNTRNTLGGDSRAFVSAGGTVYSTHQASNRLGNPNLQPEVATEIEAGLEVSSLKGRLGLDLSVFDKVTDKLITDAPIDPSTGFRNTLVNAGEIQTKGIEVALNAVPLQMGDFRWDVTVNFYKYESVVNSLSAGLTEIINAGFIGFAENAMVPGEPFNAIRTTIVPKDPDGNWIVNSDGQYQQSDGVEITGDPNPDFTSSLITNLSWKGLSLGMQWDYRQGGDIFSITAGATVGRGLAKSTEFDRAPTVILPGVKENGTDANGNTIYVPNDIQITSTDAYFNNFGFGAGEMRVFDGTTIRMREISLSYDLPSSILDKTFFKTASISLIGNNLWFKAVNFPEGLNFDTEVIGTGVGNGYGLDFLTAPSGKRYGASLRVSF